MMRCLRPIVLMLTVLAIGVGTESAHAHVTVEPAQGTAGGFASYTFRVPNEKDIPTTSLRFEFPVDMVVSRFMPKSGWTRDVVKNQSGQNIGVSWTGGSLASDEFEEFSISARNPRQVGTFAFRAFQGYADGTVVEWVGAEGSEQPAPAVRIAEGTAPVVDSHGLTGGGGAVPPAGGGNPSNPGPGGSTPGGTPAGGGSDLPLFVSLVSMVIAALALAFAVVALTRRRETAGERPAAP